MYETLIFFKETLNKLLHCIKANLLSKATLINIYIYNIFFNRSSFFINIRNLVFTVSF
jgi:hypothetical protein